MTKRISHLSAGKFIRLQTGGWTRWISDKSPEHTGWYRVKTKGRRYSCRYWDGTNWMLSDGCGSKESKSRYQNWTWRGLRIQPDISSSNQSCLKENSESQERPVGNLHNVRKAIAATAVTLNLLKALGVRKLSNPVQPRVPRSI